MSAAQWFAPLRARLARRAVDTALSEGCDPAASPRLAARARQLTSRRRRYATAVALEVLIHAIDRPPSGGHVRPSRTALAFNRDRMLDLVSVLCSPRPVYARGMATLELVVRDGTGPAYADRHGEWLAAELVRARRELDGETRPVRCAE
ncbi:MAG TPA: hypothetical protein VFN55_09900 [Solirubrobacteraceae bacterium]|nr:hypothetical protein [Solirubrobacteraceae bacterium]